MLNFLIGDKDMEVPFVDLKRSHDCIDDKIKYAMDYVIYTSSFIQGPAVEKFEKEFAQYCGKKFGVGVASGTDALTLSLIAYGIKNSEVITVANSFVATALAVKNSGNLPVLIDCDCTANIDVSKLESALTSKTKAILPVHLYGLPANMNAVLDFAKKNNLVVIEDCCQAHGAQLNGKRVPIGETGCFSFYPAKNLGGFGDGGFVATDNKDLFDSLKQIREYGSKVKYYHEGEQGFNSRLDSLQAAVLSVKLKNLDEWNLLRSDAAKQYLENLADVSEINTPKNSPNASSVYHLFAILVSKRPKLQEFLKVNGIQTGIHYPVPIHLQKMFAGLGYKKGDFPRAELFAGQTLSLPMFPFITQKEITYVCDKIKEFYSGKCVR